MKLNRNNYEEYFILYMDNELDGDGRREVEAFVKHNPDLKAELDLLMQSKLTPDAEISFAEKGSLMRFDSASISLSNYEEWLTSYIDDELTEGERRDVEVFVAGNPAIQRELNLLQQVKLQPETIVFPYKESLYRKEEKARIVAVRWWRIAAAAVLLLGISTTVVVLINNKKVVDVLPTADNRKIESNDSIKKPQNVAPTNDEPATVIENKEEHKGTREPGKTILAKQNNRPEKKNEKIVPVKDVEPVIVQNKVTPPSNERSNPVQKPDVTSNEDQTGLIAVATLPPKEKLTGSDNEIDKNIVTVSNVQPSEIAEQPSGNKSFRGFLRKVTRTIEKRTNIKTTDDNDRLLVAGLAIKL
ncbi:MAG: anti-sigma factor family protein [Chitinophagales bacterium]